MRFRRLSISGSPDPNSLFLFLVSHVMGAFSLLYTLPKEWEANPGLLRTLFTTETLHYMASFLAGALNRNISLREKKNNPVVNDQILSLALAYRFFFGKLRH